MNNIPGLAIKRTIIFTLTFFLLVGSMIISNTVYGHKPSLYILNASGKAWDAAYFANENGDWNNPDASLAQAEFTHSILSHHKLYHDALFRVVVGSKLGKSYCTATIALPAFGQHPHLIKHNGNCHFTHTNNGELAMVIDPANNNNQRVLFSQKNR